MTTSPNIPRPIVTPLEEVLQPLFTAGGSMFYVGDTPEMVPQYFKQAIRRLHYSQTDETGVPKQPTPMNEDELRNLQLSVLDAMRDYYAALLDEECLMAVNGLYKKLASIDKILVQSDQISNSLRQQPAPKRKQGKRGEIAYDETINSCFVPAPEVERQRLLDCLSETCTLARQEMYNQGHDIITTNVPQIIVGDERDIVLKGSAPANRIWVSQLVRSYCVDHTLCLPVEGLSNAWAAAHQAFLHAYRQPYSDGHFRQAKTSTAEAQALARIIAEQQRHYRLVT